MRGVDISHYQKGLTIQQIKDAGNEFAIIKLTEGTWLVDSAAFDFYREAFELGFPVGCYCYSHAVSAPQARAEAAFLLDAINRFPMPCGIFLDIEEPKQLGLSREELLNTVRGWCETIARAGYIPGVYGSEGTLWAKLRPDELPDGTLVWVARWGNIQPNTPCDLWQNSDSGSIACVTVDTDETRSVYFKGLVYSSYSIFENHRDGGHPDPVGEPGEMGNAPDSCPIDGPCDSPLELVAEFLRTDACRELFKAYIAGKE